MTIRRQMLVGCISLILPLCCLAANLKNEEPVNNRALARSFLSGLLDKINSGQFIDMFAAGDVVAKVKKRGGRLRRVFVMLS